MQETAKYLYTFNYDRVEADLCKLESRAVFGKEESNKQLFSDIEIEPSISAFIKCRVEIMASSQHFEELVTTLKRKSIKLNDFKVSYLSLASDQATIDEKKDKARQLGYCFFGYPNFDNPTTTFAICHNNGVWYFGTLLEKDKSWHKHKHKPRLYSSSISTNIAKTLVNVATKANKDATIIDACCGVGTIMLEACFSGYQIEGCDISWKICNDAKENLSHFNYTATVYDSDIAAIQKTFDAAIIDLPYSLSSHTTEEEILHIIQSTACIAKRLVIVSTTDIANMLSTIGLTIIDSCTVSKRGKVTFARKIWVCEKVG